MDFKLKMEQEISDLLHNAFKKYYGVYTQFLHDLDQQIYNNLQQNGIESRDPKCNGLWCCALIPSILVLYSLGCEVSDLYKFLALESLGLLAYSILFILFITVSSTVIQDNCFGGSVASGLLSAVLICIFCETNLLEALCFSFSSMYFYGVLLPQCLVWFPRTFTLGELMIVLQGSVLFINMILYTFTYKSAADDDYLVRSSVVSVLATVGFIIVMLVHMDENNKTWKGLMRVMGMATVFLLVLLHFFLGLTCFTKIFTFIFFNKKRVSLIIEWGILSAVAVFLLTSRTIKNLKADSVTRKSFHILASLVFIRGIMMDVALMRLAAGICLGAIILAEALRKSRIKPVSDALQSAFEVYKDEKDNGMFAVTPIYLFVGLSCPLLLVPDHAHAPLELLSGVLSIGIGDSAASAFGKTYGCTYWPGSQKTLEGTAFNILSQLIVVYILCLLDVLPVDYPMIRTLIAATVGAIVEAKTVQVDNIIIPLVTLLAFQAASVILFPLATIF